MKSLLIDVENAEVKLIEINDYRDFYSSIKCDAFDVARRCIGDENMMFDIFCDDIGKLKPIFIVSAIDPTGRCALVGNIVITKTNENGEQISLTNDEIKYLRSYIRTGRRFVGNKVISYPVLVDVKYQND